MNPEDIQQAFIQRCKTTAQSLGLTPALLNAPTSGADTLPRIEMDFTDPVRSNILLQGGAVKTEIGRFVPSIVVEKGTLTATINGFANSIAALFPKGQTMTITGGTITITEVPTIRSGYPDEATWRVPLTIRYRADAT